MWIANYSGTPLQSTRNRTHMGLSVAPASVDRRAGSTCVISRRPPRPACPLGYESPPCRTSWTGPVLAVPTASPPSGPPRPPHTRPLPSAGLRCRLCESVHSPALPCPGGAGGLCPPAACPGAPQSPPTASSRLGSAARTQPPAPFWNPPRVPGKTRDLLLSQRGCLLLRAPGGLR